MIKKQKAIEKRLQRCRLRIAARRNMEFAKRIEPSSWFPVPELLIRTLRPHKAETLNAKAANGKQMYEHLS